MERTEKTCKTCGVVKPATDFYLASDRRNLQPHCKTCHVERTRLYYHALPPEKKAMRVATIKARKYGMTLGEMQAFVADHDENCDVCGKPDTTHRKLTWTRQLTLDHDHVTGKMRGLLCSDCNLALGHASDDPERLRKLADYVERCR